MQQSRQYMWYKIESATQMCISIYLYLINIVLLYSSYRNRFKFSITSDQKCVSFEGFYLSVDAWLWYMCPPICIVSDSTANKLLIYKKNCDLFVLLFLIIINKCVLVKKKKSIIFWCLTAVCTLSQSSVVSLCLFSLDFSKPFLRSSSMNVSICE